MMSVDPLTLTLDDYFALPLLDRYKLNAWAEAAIGERWADVYTIRVREGWCEFERYVTDGPKRFATLRWGDCEECYGATVIWIRQRVRCPLPPVWPMLRESASHLPGVL